MNQKLRKIAPILMAIALLASPLSGAYADVTGAGSESTQSSELGVVSFDDYIKNFEYYTLLSKADYEAAKKQYDDSMTSALNKDYKKSGEQFKACYLILFQYEKQFNLTRPIQTLAEVLKYAPTNMTKVQKKGVETLYAQMLEAYNKKDADQYDQLSKKMQTRLINITYWNLPYLSASDHKTLDALTAELEKYNYVTQTEAYDATYQKINKVLEKYIPEQRAYELKQAVLLTQQSNPIPKKDLDKLNQYISGIEKALKAKKVAQSEKLMTDFNHLLRKYQSKMFIDSQNRNIDDMAKQYGWSTEITKAFKALIVKIDQAEINGDSQLISKCWEAYEVLIQKYAIQK